MRNLWVVTKKEFLGMVKTKGFVIGIFLGPLILGAFMFLPAFLARKSKEPQLKMAVIDKSGWLFNKLDSVLVDTLPDGQRAYILSREPYRPQAFKEDENKLRGRVLKKKLDAYLVIPAGVDTGAPPEYYARSVGNVITQSRLENRINDLLVSRRLEAQGIVVGNLKSLLKETEIELRQVTEKGTAKTSFLTVYLTSFFLVMILFTTVLGYGQHLARSIVEEKNTRIIEVLTSSATPFQLLMGKTIGLGGAALTAVLGMFLLGFLFGAPLVRILEMENIKNVFNPVLLINFVLYLLLGYFLFMTIFTILGAISNSDQEVQSMVAPIVWMMILPIIIGFLVAQNPNAGWITVLSLIPFFTPTLMVMRISYLPPSWPELAASYAIMFFSILAMGWLAAKIYRVGILMYGKRPTLPELARWVRYR
ncbi:MAG: ABC transporter permease [candidate division Zixibacteria bacterium]|nr:ABC transporter permease [candidate division Zixibacteria bacterium]